MPRRSLKNIIPYDIERGELADTAAIGTSAGADQLTPLLQSLLELIARLNMQPPAACRVSVLCTQYELPEKTLHQIEILGLGPRQFVIGRLKYCLIADWVNWLEHLAETGGTRLTGKRRQAEQVEAYTRDPELRTRITRAAHPAKKSTV